MLINTNCTTPVISPALSLATYCPDKDFSEITNLDQLHHPSEGRKLHKTV